VWMKKMDAMSKTARDSERSNKKSEWTENLFKAD
jgi:hypothetical protein